MWAPPTPNWWKLNSDAAYANGRAALAFVIRDDLGLLVKALSKTPLASSLKLKLWNGFCQWQLVRTGKTFYSLLMLYKWLRIWSGGEYHIRDQVLLIRKQLAVNGWSMVWNARSSNRFANALAKKAMSSLCNFSFSSSNLICLLDDLSKILMADMAGINISL